MLYIHHIPPYHIFHDTQNIINIQPYPFFINREMSVHTFAFNHILSCGTLIHILSIYKYTKMIRYNNKMFVLTPYIANNVSSPPMEAIMDRWLPWTFLLLFSFDNTMWLFMYSFLPDPGVSGVRSMGPGLSIYVTPRPLVETLLM